MNAPQRKPAALQAYSLNDDQLTAKYTAFKSTNEMLNTKGGYRQSFYVAREDDHRRREEIARLADCYDAYQAARGDPRRAHRGWEI